MQARSQNSSQPAHQCALRRRAQHAVQRVQAVCPSQEWHAADSVEEWDARGYPARGVDRVGKPYGAAGQLVGGAAAEGTAAEDQCGRFASLMCSAQLCCDTLGMKVEGTHNVFWLAKCTGWSLVSTPEAPVLEMYVVTCGRAVSVSVDSVSNRTGAWQLQWIDDSLVGECAVRHA